MNKKVQKNQGAILTKLLVFHVIYYSTKHNIKVILKDSDCTLQIDRKGI